MLPTDGVDELVARLPTDDKVLHLMQGIGLSLVDNVEHLLSYIDEVDVHVILVDVSDEVIE